MKTFRAYIENDAGAVTWAAWIEAAHLDEARRLADALRPGSSLELWSARGRDLAPGSRLDPV